MSHINLLPWREKQREKHKQLYLAMLGCLSLLTVGLVMGVGSILDSMIKDQQNRNQFLEKQSKFEEQVSCPYLQRVHKKSE